MSTINIIGVAASVFTAISLLPQLIKLLREKKANDVSLVMLAVLFAGLGLWIAYGWLKHDWIIIISNCFSFTVNIILAYFAIKYKNRK
jgi:MtN3 and saliva related transmembrane protein